MEVYDRSNSPAPAPLPAAAAMPGNLVQEGLMPEEVAQGLPTWQTLANQYNELRRTQHSSDARTRAMSQLWGIKSIGKRLALARADTTADEVQRLKSFLEKLERGTDCHYELSRILDEHRTRQKKAS